MKRRALAALLIFLGAGAAARGAVDREGAPAGERFTVMVHGWAFLTSNRQGGDSGDQDFESQNHLMIMATRPAGKWTLTLLGTFTAEPLTVPPQGSPELFQRGETYKGVLLVDRQHPHDLFVQLAAEWSRGLGRGARLRLYAAPWGEPAVGPTTYVHRQSASADPLAPLGHHNQDSTHISADVLTAGVDAGRWSLEGSAFHGREPDENRWDIEQGNLDSYSGRVGFTAMAGLRVQVSAARREHPESLEAGDQTRQTASVEYERMNPGGFIATTLVAGRNLLEGGQVEWGNTLEATWKFATKHTVYGRIERVDRDRDELLGKAQRPASSPAHRTAVEALTLGYLRDLPLLMEAETGLGAGVTVYRFDESLDQAYGDRPVSAQVFLRLRFGSTGAAHHHHGALRPANPQRAADPGSPGNRPGG